MRRLWMLCGLSLAVGFGHELPPAHASASGKERNRSAQQPARPVQLIERDEGTRRILEVHNELAIPVSAVLIFTGSVNVHGVPAAPVHRVIPPGEHLRLATLSPRDPRFPMTYRHSFSYAVDYSPQTARGEPAGPAYDLPWAGGPFRMSQGAGGDYSHQSPMGRYAVDIAMPEGTPILAARDGVVLAVQNDQAGRGPSAAGNFVRIGHEDGAQSAYMHLARGSVRVQPGDRVRAGDPIGASGNTGRSTGPHLHFVVQREVGDQLRSVPFRFSRHVGPLPNFARTP